MSLMISVVWMSLRQCYMTTFELKTVATLLLLILKMMIMITMMTMTVTMIPMMMEMTSEVRVKVVSLERTAP